jgi:hypothetical protein
MHAAAPCLKQLTASIRIATDAENAPGVIEHDGLLGEGVS